MLRWLIKTTLNGNCKKITTQICLLSTMSRHKTQFSPNRSGSINQSSANECTLPFKNQIYDKFQVRAKVISKAESIIKANYLRL